MNTSRRHQLTASLALGAIISAATLAAAPAMASNVRSSTSDDASQPSICAAESTPSHGPVDIRRSRPHGVPIPQ